MRFAIPVVVLVVFSGFSTLVTLEHGYTGFITLALREPWAMQMLLDLVIAFALFISWMRRDAATRRLPFWPYAIGTVLLGSMGALAYLAHREWRQGNPA